MVKKVHLGFIKTQYMKIIPLYFDRKLEKSGNLYIWEEKNSIIA